MIYNKFEDVPNGKLFFDNTPYMNHRYDIDYTALKIREGKKTGYFIKGFNKIKNKNESVDIRTLESVNYIIGDTYDGVLKEKAKILYRLREKIIFQHTERMINLDKELGEEFFNCLEDNPEITI